MTIAGVISNIQTNGTIRTHNTKIRIINHGEITNNITIPIDNTISSNVKNLIVYEGIRRINCIVFYGGITNNTIFTRRKEDQR
jgi:hypothetical protein